MTHEMHAVSIHETKTAPKQYRVPAIYYTPPGPTTYFTFPTLAVRKSKTQQLLGNTGTLEERMEKFERNHTPTAYPRKEICFACPALLGGEGHGGRLFGLCFKCLRAEKARLERQRLIRCPLVPQEKYWH